MTEFPGAFQRWHCRESIQCIDCSKCSLAEFSGALPLCLFLEPIQDMDDSKYYMTEFPGHFLDVVVGNLYKASLAQNVQWQSFRGISTMSLFGTNTRHRWLNSNRCCHSSVHIYTQSADDENHIIPFSFSYTIWMYTSMASFVVAFSVTLRPNGLICYVSGLSINISKAFTVNGHPSSTEIYKRGRIVDYSGIYFRRTSLRKIHSTSRWYSSSMTCISYEIIHFHESIRLWHLRFFFNRC